MTGKLIAAIAAGIVGVLLCCGGLAGAILGSGDSSTPGVIGCDNPAAAASSANHSTPAQPPVGDWTAEQVTNAATIVLAGANLGLRSRGWVIAVATAMQESALRNLGDLGERNDHDSLGLFQQRPTAGWGTPTQILNPVYAATKFYQKLLTVGGWPDLPLTVVAQAVQRSAYPDAYTKWEKPAQALVDTLTDRLGPQLSDAVARRWSGCIDDGGDGLPDEAGLMPPPGFMLPPDTPPAVTTAIAWALQQLGTPYTFGGDCTDSHGSDPAHRCDCSSLVQQAYHAAGLNLPRTAAEQSHTGSSIPSIDDLLPGDLIFIPGTDGTRNQPGHVGMYLGDGLLIQAPHTGDHVRISRLWTDIPVARRIVAWP